MVMNMPRGRPVTSLLPKNMGRLPIEYHWRKTPVKVRAGKWVSLNSDNRDLLLYSKEFPTVAEPQAWPPPPFLSDDGRRDTSDYQADQTGCSEGQLPLGGHDIFALVKISVIFSELREGNDNLHDRRISYWDRI